MPVCEKTYLAPSSLLGDVLLRDCSCIFPVNLAVASVPEQLPLFECIS